MRLDLGCAELSPAELSPAHARLLRRPFIELSQAEVLHQNISLRRSWISGEKTL
jgi:hypothetical protein